ncbi:hypothetical protein NDU88_004091 [Pleurodeles waltl]|uniref:40S ribosomal protein S6 n=1 Tax=Pleurodeles waltl TaxID=8319 RepID=A0AAV7PIS0_PLEWA|nr:hypothetical protein NDU88_004091 [Pleurodeles waltl]
MPRDCRKPTKQRSEVAKAPRTSAHQTKGTKAPRDHQRLPSKAQMHPVITRIALKKQCTKKNKEKASEYAKLLAKRMKEAKEKRQEQIVKRRRLSSLKASTS